MNKSTLLLIGTALGATAAGILYHKNYSTNEGPRTMWKEKPSGDTKSMKTIALEQSASLMQNFDPVKNLTSVHFNGFHPLKSKPEHQVSIFHLFFVIIFLNLKNELKFKRKIHTNVYYFD